MTISLLGHALLGLLGQEERSGYDLRRTFSLTPMARFSDSPGAIYPALRRLERQGLIRGKVHASAGLRRKRLYRLTSRGRTELRRWLATPVTRQDVTRGQAELMLRFSHMDREMGPRDAVRLLQELERELAAYLALLRDTQDSTPLGVPLSSRLALDCGVRGYESWHAWTRMAIRAYRSAKRRTR